MGKIWYNCLCSLACKIVYVLIPGKLLGRVEEKEDGFTSFWINKALNLDTYLSDWEYLNDDLDDVKYTDAIAKMVQTKEPLAGWGIVEKDGKTYYIEYAS